MNAICTGCDYQGHTTNRCNTTKLLVDAYQKSKMQSAILGGIWYILFEKGDSYHSMTLAIEEEWSKEMIDLYDTTNGQSILI